MDVEEKLLARRALDAVDCLACDRRRDGRQHGTARHGRRRRGRRRPEREHNGNHDTGEERDNDGDSGHRPPAPPHRYRFATGWLRPPLR
jgi:hypothetical protein